jgi:hypothetical protein
MVQIPLFPKALRGLGPRRPEGIRYTPGMANPPPVPPLTPVLSALRAAPARADDDKTVCERCGAEMYRMHAVWRCPTCRFKTDCCGW